MWPFKKYRIIERKDGKFVAQVRDDNGLWKSIDRDTRFLWSDPPRVEQWCLHNSMRKAEECLTKFKRRQQSEAKRKENLTSDINRVFWR